MVKMCRVNLSIPESLYKDLQTVSASASCTTTHTIRQTLLTFAEAKMTGQRKCITGDSCLMNFVPRFPPADEKLAPR